MLGHSCKIFIGIGLIEYNERNIRDKLLMSVNRERICWYYTGNHNCTSYVK